MKRCSLFNFPLVLVLLVIFGTASLMFFSCQSNSMINENSVIGIWVGGAYELDLDEYQPFAKIIEFTPEGQFLEWKTWTNKVDTFDYSFSLTALHVDTFEYHKSDIDEVGDELHWGRRFTRFYKKIYPVTDLDSLQIRNWLTQQNWKLNDTIFQFGKAGRFKVSKKGANYCLEYCFRFASYRGHLFLLKKGNHLECGAYSQFLEQVIAANEREITVVCWEGEGFTTKTYKAVSEALPCNDDAPFQLCNKYLYINYPEHRYYYKGTTYQGGLYVINKIFKQTYQTPEQSAESGLIRVRFVVNCEGKAGLFEMLELDNDYQVKAFDPEISRQIFSITQTLQNWNPGKKDGQNIDTYKYLTFKIKNGEIIDIFP